MRKSGTSKNWPSPTVKKAWRIVRPLLILTVSLAITYGVISYAFNFVMDRYINPVNSDDATPIEVTVQSNDSASKIASVLYEAGGEEGNGLISNKAVFKIYIDFVGKANKLQAGTYILSRNMDIPQIVDILTTETAESAIRTIRYRVPEGSTIYGVVKALNDAGLTIDEKEFLALCNDREKFDVYFQEKIPEGDGRDFLLEGYLFPDTYDAYSNAKPETIITRMLVRFNEIFTAEYIERAQELDMTIDEVVTLASIIEREASADTDFPKVSAVFHNRLRAEQKLESCATLQYVHKDQPPKLEYTAEEQRTPSAYNTYLNAGLPVGPISNPSKRALEAALYPDETFIGEDYRYFCTQNPEETKELVFAKTYEEHQENVAKYRQYWS